MQMYNHSQNYKLREM